MFAVTVTITLHPEQEAAFLPLMLENARASVRDEPGCRQFDVCTDPDTPGTVFLYELYDDRAAFDAHLATPHFLKFDGAVAAMIADKRIVTFRQVAQ